MGSRTPEREMEREEAGWDESWSSPALKDLLPDLGHDEQVRFRLPSSCEGGGRVNRQTKSKKQMMMEMSTPPRREDPLRSEEVRDSFILPKARQALRHYNARHPGAEFDCVKPLMQNRVIFRNQVWFHLNFWARSRATNKIKRFFAEVHYKPAESITSVSVCSRDAVIPGVEVCTIIEEPLNQYKRSCAFCPASDDILHPKGCRKFVCGNDKDRFEQRLTICTSGLWLGRPFSCHSDPNALRTIRARDEEQRRQQRR